MKTSEKIAKRQKIFFIAAAALILSIIGFLVFSGGEKEKSKSQEESRQVNVISEEVNSEVVRLSSLERQNDALIGRIHVLECALQNIEQSQGKNEKETGLLVEETRKLIGKIDLLEDKIDQPSPPLHLAPGKGTKSFNAWGGNRKEGRHVAFEIPAGTVLKAVLVSGADCSVAVQKPTGPNMVLLRPLDYGQLPRNVRVPLKGSVFLGNAIGDLSSERVYIRGERLTLVERGGSFVETEVSAYVSGEDGREGMRGVVVDRSGQIISRAAFAAFLQGVGQTTESIATLHGLGKLEKNDSATDAAKQILGIGAFHGGNTALGKMADYYIKRAEQLQPTIQIAAGRIVDIVFTKTVKIGEKDLKKKFDLERAAKQYDS